MPRREPRARSVRCRHRGPLRGLRSPFLLTVLAAGACASEPRPEPAAAASGDTVVDAAGTRHVFTRPATRIVSLVPSATVTVRTLGAEASLVGRTDYDTAAWISSLPSVGGGLDPSLEAIVALAPDLVIRFAGEQDPRTPARLDELGIRHVAVRPTSLDGIFATTDIVGRITGREAAADSLGRAIRQGLAALERRVAELPRVRIAYVLGGSPPWVSGPGTYIHEIVSIVGGDNVFSDLDAPYTSVGPEEFRVRDIDVVLVSHAGSFDEALTPGARVEVVGSGLENPGPGVVEAAWSVAEAMHGRTLR